MFFGMTPLEALLAGSLAQTWGPAVAVAIGATVTLTFAIGLLLFVPLIRRLEA
jgi:hypothetical protein